MSDPLAEPRRLAQQLVAERVDVNEVEKVLAYARRMRDMDKVRRMIQRLATQDTLVYSKQTKRYAKAIHQVFGPVLSKQPGASLYLLGWTVRLMRYEAARPRSQSKGNR
jgi:hypothetical protein